MKHEIVINVSGLEPPEPLERVLDAIGTLGDGQYLRTLINREPFPLYTILEDTGFKHDVREGEETFFEIFIWRRTDEAAAAAVRAVLGTGADSGG